MTEPFRDYTSFSKKALAGETLTKEEAFSILKSPDETLPLLLDAAFEVRQKYHGKRVKVCMLMNIQSGLCPEDCNYCSQSSVSSAEIEKYPLLTKERILANAAQAHQAGAKRFCMVASGRGPTDKEIQLLSDVTKEIRSLYPLEICCSLGIMDERKAERLKEAGVGWVNHNLNTSERYYSSICTTHTYADRVRTVENVEKAGLSTCSGGILGMGEKPEDIVELAFKVREMDIDSIPINFLHPIEGTPLSQTDYLTPEMALKILCLFRFLNPEKEIRVAGGRERTLKDKQGLALYAANSIFIEGYLTTPGQKAEEAYTLIESMGFEIEK